MATSFLDPILNPLLHLHPLLSLTLLSFIISLAMTLVYKYFTDQNVMKSLKDEIKELQKEAKSLKEKPSEVMHIQKQMMQTNMKYMTMSFKPLLISMLPILLLIGWMSAHYSFEAIKPNQDFSVTIHFKKPMMGDLELIPSQGITSESTTKEVNSDSVLWILRGEEGIRKLSFDFNGKVYEKEVIITNGDDYADKEIRFKEKSSDVKSISIEYQKRKFLNLHFFQLGWLGTYFILSIIFSIGMRKLLKVY